MLGNAKQGSKFEFAGAVALQCEPRTGAHR